MSSTNRGSERSASDYYVTPGDVVASCLAEMEVLGLFDRAKPMDILDPAAGGNPATPYLNETGMPYPDALSAMFPEANIDTVDIRRDSKARLNGTDFLSLDPVLWHRRYDLVMTNPPFSDAEAMIRHSFRFLEPGGMVVMLLRLNFLEGLKRKPFFDSYMPSHIFVHRRRICFKSHIKYDSKGTDSIAYAHYVWSRNLNSPSAELRIID